MRKTVLLCICACVLFGCCISAMASEQLFEYSLLDNNGYYDTYPFSVAQTFTVGSIGDNVSFRLTNISFKTIGFDIWSGDNFTVYVAKTDAEGRPVSDFKTNYVARQNVSSDVFEFGVTFWLNVSFEDSSGVLKRGETYALIVNNSIFDTAYWYVDAPDGLYPGGDAFTWNATTEGFQSVAERTGYGSFDLTFKVYGEKVTPSPWMVKAEMCPGWTWWLGVAGACGGLFVSCLFHVRRSS